ncbi:MAG: WHG domain-containing protein, partial [Sphingomonadaceae bacterium]|nr:WHG domain-containing protein [Sphingomonadaceae bacterium]
PTAPAHHFGDARGLLTSLATEAFRQFGNALTEADAAAEPTARVRAQGIAYVEFALAHPALFDLMWRRALLDLDDPEFRAVSRRAFALLEAGVAGREPRAANPPELVDPRTIASWSIVHGFARLVLDGAFGLDREEAAESARAALPHVLDCLDIAPGGSVAEVASLG